METHLESVRETDRQTDRDRQTETDGGREVRETDRHRQTQSDKKKTHCRLAITVPVGWA